MKWLWLLLLGLCVLAIPQKTTAALYVGITATGEEAGALPGAPVNFDAVLISDYQVDLSWDLGAFATKTIVIGKIGEYPADITDGYEVYNGVGTSVTDWVDLSTTDLPMYYRAWSWNAVGYSPGYAEDYVEGGGVGMSQALLFIPLVCIALGLTGLGYYRDSKGDRGWPVVLVAGLAWLIFPVYGFIQAESAMDIYALIGYIGVVMLILCGLEPFIMRKDEPELGLTERWEERENKILGPKRRMRE